MNISNRMRMIRREFRSLWGPADELICAQAPARVNLIGEHTDYNDGFVLPMTVDLDIIIAGRPNGRNFARVFSTEFGFEIEFHTRRLETAGLPSWARYIVGAARKLDTELPGFDAVIHSTVPIGAGLSSSAAFTVAASLFMARIADVHVNRKDLALRCQRVEHDDVGVNCGIMDQTAVLLARASHALLIDCRTLMYEWVALPLDGYSICICDSGVKHELAATQYNKRRAECDAAARFLSKRLPGVRALRDVTLAELEREGQGLPPTVFKRARHVVTENQRVVESVDALKRGDLATFGRLLNESHDSLKNDYAVSCAELDLLVAAQQSFPDVLGARLTGAGFGGCTVSIVKSDTITDFIEIVSQRYDEAFSRTPKIFVSEATKGARVFVDSD